MDVVKQLKKRGYIIWRNADYRVEKDGVIIWEGESTLQALLAIFRDIFSREKKNPPLSLPTNDKEEEEE